MSDRVVRRYTRAGLYDWNNFVASPVAPVGSDYEGPGDIVSGAVGWWGLRAYNVAAIGQNAVRLVRASDSAQQNFVTLATGSVDVASITTFLASTTGKVVTLFDQSGAGMDLTQATDANRPTLSLSVLGSLPAIAFVKASSHKLQSGFLTQVDQPFSYSVVANRTGTTGSPQSVLAAIGANGPLVGFGAANIAQIYAGVIVARAATDGAFHAIAGAFNDDISAINVDGTSTSGDAGATESHETMAMGTDDFAQFFDGYCVEGGRWPGAFDATQMSNMSANQHTYWGF